MKHNSKSFSLVEIIIVLVILSTIILIGIPFYSGFLQRSRDDRRILDINRIHEALQRYHANQIGGYYPSNLNVLVTQRYLNSMPLDPVSRLSSAYQYLAIPFSCDNVVQFCTGFFLSVSLEQKGSGYEFNSGDIKGFVIP